METCETTLQKQLYGIAVFEEEIVLEDFTADTAKRFIVTPEQLMGFFRTGVTFRPFQGLIWMQDHSDRSTSLFTVPPTMRTILYRHKKKVTAKALRLPSLAIKVATGSDAGKITSIDLWAFSGRDLKPDSILYEVPLPNVSRSSMCLGSTIRAIDGDLREATLRTIFDTPFNHHNDIVGHERLSFGDYHKKYRGTCPLRTLKAIGKGREILEVKP